MPREFLYDVFLSHNSKDKVRVRRLAERLKKEGLRVWFNEWNIAPGEIISLKMDEGLEQSRVMVLCVSRHALASGWVALERRSALHRGSAALGHRFVPLLLDDCDLPDTLQRYKHVDFRNETESAFAALLTASRVSIEEQAFVQLDTKSTVIVQCGDRFKNADPSEEETTPLLVFERRIKGHENWVTCLDVSWTERVMASGSADKTVKLWNLDTGENLATFRGHRARITSVKFVDEGLRIISGSHDEVVRVWHEGPIPGWPLLGHTSPVSGVAGLQHGKILSLGKHDGIRVWDVVTGECIEKIREFNDPEDGMNCFDVGGDPLIGLVGRESGEVIVWDLNRKIAHGISAHSLGVNSVAVDAKGRYGVSGSDDKTVKVWNLRKRTCIGTLEGHNDDVVGVAIAPDGKTLASCGFTDQTVRLWDRQTGQTLQIVKFERAVSPTCVTFSSDGKLLCIGTARAEIYIFTYARRQRAMTKSIERRYVNAKVVLVGEGGVGKTSLAHRLIEDRYVIKDRTHGMNVWRLDLPLPPDTILEREALLWDFAGQEDYRLIHRLFLGETTLALLLINPQNPDPFAEAGDWLKALQVAVSQPESKQELAKILIFSQVDVGGMKLGGAKIDRFCKHHCFTNWLPTSAKAGQNCSDKQNGEKPSMLKQLIGANIPWKKLPWTITPLVLRGLKNAVIAMRDERDIRLLRFAELVQRLEQLLPGEKFGEADVRTAVRLLANHGLVRMLKFGDLVLLQPELISGYAGAVIRAARMHVDEIGCVPEADIYWPEFDFTGVERLRHRADEELFLRALVQTLLDHSLCIAEDTSQGRLLVFPSQYRREKDTPHNPDVFVSYSFSGEWQTIWTSLIVRLWYSHEFERHELWRNAAEFGSSRGHVLGLKIDTQRGEGLATISLYFDKEVPDELKVIFIEFVHRHLAKCACEVSRDRRYACSNCTKPIRDLDVVRKRLESKKDFITCQECDERVPLIDFIEQRLKSDPVARKILAMDETATRELDTQALEQILIGHMMAIAGEANQIFRPTAMFDHGIDGEVEFKDDDGKASGRRIYIQLKSGNSYLRTRKKDGSEVFDVKDERHLDYWVNQPVDVYLVIRQTEDYPDYEQRPKRSHPSDTFPKGALVRASGTNSGTTIRWMNVTRYLKGRKGEEKKSRQIIFKGEKLDMEAVWKVRDGFFPKARERK